jgi:hypothetical protein
MSTVLPGTAAHGIPDPGKIRMTTDLCQESLSAEESEYPAVL